MKLLSLILIGIITGCGLIQKSEIPSTRIILSTKDQGCKLPKWNTLIEKETTSIQSVKSATSCIESRIDDAFKNLRGTVENEFSISEIKILHKEKFLDFIPELNNEDWKLIGIALRIIHPRGEEKLSKEVLKSFLRSFEELTPYYVRGIHTDWYNTKAQDLRWVLEPATVTAFENLVQVISPKFKISLLEVQEVAEPLFKRIAPREYKKGKLTSAQIKNKLEAAWILKSIFLSDKNLTGVRSDFSGESLKELIHLGFDIIRNSPHTIDWGFDYAVPNKVPVRLSEEWNSLASLFVQYIDNHKFNSIEREELALAIRTLDPRTTLSELSRDLISISQRLTTPAEREPGLNPKAFKALFREAGAIAQDIYEAGKFYPTSCAKSLWQCEIPIREALKSPLLRRVALKGGIEWWRLPVPSNGEEPKAIKPFTVPLSWETVESRLINRRLMGKVFDALAPTGHIPLSGDTEDDLKDTLNLAYTFLRFASVQPPSPKATEDKLPVVVSIKPGSLYRVMGLVGDRLMLDGNQDNSLDREEFFGITQYYESIQYNARNLGWGGSNGYYNLPNEVSWHPIFGRRGFIDAMISSGIKSYFPYLFIQIKSLTPTILQSLFHSLIGNPKQKPIQVYPNGNTHLKLVTLKHYLESDAALAPAAILTTLEALNIRCDFDEDGLLNWHELGCATPILLDAGLETLQSELISVDPGPHDIAQMILKFLKSPGVPRHLARLLMVNGGISKYNLNKDYPELKIWLDESLTLSYTDIARFISMEEPDKIQNKYWEYEANKRYGKCDSAPSDKILKGKAELDCFVSVVFDGLLTSLSQVLSNQPNPELILAFEELGKSEFFYDAIKLSTKDMDLPVFNLFRSSPVKIISLLEELIHRAPENALDPEDVQ